MPSRARSASGGLRGARARRSHLANLATPELRALLGAVDGLARRLPRRAILRRILEGSDGARRGLLRVAPRRRASACPPIRGAPPGLGRVDRKGALRLLGPRQ